MRQHHLSRSGVLRGCDCYFVYISVGVQTVKHFLHKFVTVIIMLSLIPSFFLPQLSQSLQYLSISISSRSQH